MRMRINFRRRPRVRLIARREYTPFLGTCGRWLKLIRDIAPHPPPFGAHPPPPPNDPRFIPVPTGIRGVFATQAALLRSHPEFYRLAHRIPPLNRPARECRPAFPPEEVMRIWVVLLDPRPEINPAA